MSKSALIALWLIATIGSGIAAIRVNSAFWGVTVVFVVIMILIAKGEGD